MKLLRRLKRDYAQDLADAYMASFQQHRGFPTLCLRLTRLDYVEESWNVRAQMIAVAWFPNEAMWW